MLLSFALSFALTVTTSAHIAPCADDACIRRALSADGAVAVTGVAGLAAARKAALSAWARCAAARRPSGARDVVLDDGTLRRTVGARTLRSSREPFAAAGCAELEASTLPLSRLVEAAAERVLRAVEPLRAPNASAPTLSEQVADGEQLEHLHLYVPPRAPTWSSSSSSAAAAPALSAEPTAPQALKLHTDAGLFIALVPALWLHPGDSADFDDEDEAAALADGFAVQRADGRLARLAPGAAADESVVVLLGDGWTEWANPQLATPLRAAPHALAVAPRAADAPDASVRLWFGRMYLPHGHSGKAGGDDEEDAMSAAGCARGRRALVDTDGCFADQKLCWHACYSTAGAPCAEEQITCRNTGNEVSGNVAPGGLWLPGDEGTNHCTSCALTCDPTPPSPPPPSPSPTPPPPSYPPAAPLGDPAMPPPPPGTTQWIGEDSEMDMHSGPPFCSGAGTDMHMTGFAFFPTDCVIYLFREWRLDSAAKFAFAVLGTVLLGVLTESLTYFRREKLAPSSATRLKGRPRLWHVAMAAIFTIQARAAADAAAAARPPDRPTDPLSTRPPRRLPVSPTLRRRSATS